MSLTEKLEYIKTYTKLKQQEEIIEKGIELFLNNIKMDSEVMKNLKEEYNTCTERSNDVLFKLYGEIIELNTDFENIKSIVNQFNNGKIIDVNDCKTKMNELLEKMQKFEKVFDLEILQKEQKELEDYLYDFKVNLRKYEATKNLTSTRCKVNQSSGNKNKITAEDYSEIKDFESLIAKTGHMQNWKEEDHKYFVQIRNKINGIPALVTEIKKKFPDLSAEKIINHEVWYKIYLELREKQRSSVKSWRAKKELEKKEKIEFIKNNECEKSNSRCESKNDIELNDNKSESAKKLISNRDINKIVDKKKEMIKQWKIDKARAKIASELELKNQLEIKRIFREKQFVKRVMENKEALIKYQEDKMNRIVILPEKNEKIIKSPSIIQSFRRKDDAFINKRKRLLESKNQNYIKYKINNNNVNKLNNIKSNHVSTLMKSTIIWNEKCKKQETLENQNPFFYIKDIPKLLRHNWRNQESFT
ncbi:coiled-coil domain-containing protein 112-like isoform X1 [Microplitis mediator]|uniref:coiled-coil domain-containing protein 112-like isoform X1 n=1 Tax=Microplitis mediator TaxID=375433 RepID=UPI0025525931|nr:coiled-coil domain-containing protein 112-like isoform X1 [Microplitis mediator]